MVCVLSLLCSITDPLLVVVVVVVMVVVVIVVVLVKVKQSCYRPGVAQRVPGS